MPSTMTAARTTPRRHEADRPATQPSGHRRLGLALILTAAFMVVLDFSIVNVALASIEREFGFSASAVQWIVTGYAIAFGGLLILGGRAADMFGRRRMFMAGLAIFSAASLAGGLAHDPVLLVASRVVQGAGAALVAPVRAVPDHHRLRRGAGAHPRARHVRRDRVDRVRRRPGARRRAGRSSPAGGRCSW